MLKIRHFHQFISYVSMVKGTIVSFIIYMAMNQGFFIQFGMTKHSFLAYLVVYM